MKTKFTAILMTLLLCPVIQGQQPKEVTTLVWSTPFTNFPLILNGRIRELNNHLYWGIEKDGKLEKGSSLTLQERTDNLFIVDFQIWFDSTGNVLRSDRFGDSDSELFSLLNEFADNKQVKEVWLQGNIQVVGEAAFIYDDRGFLKKIEMKMFNPDTLASLVITNDDKGNMIQMDVLDSKNVFMGKTVYAWNDKGKVVNVANYSLDDKPIEIIKVTYNDKGWYETFTVMDETGAIKIKAVSSGYQYDDKGNCIRYEMTNMKGQKFISESNYTYY